MDKFRVFVHMLIRDASLKQRIPHAHLISSGAFSVAKKCALYTGKYGLSVCLYVCIRIRQIAFKMHLLVIKDKLMLFLFLL